jgi:histidinol-phosphatase (PHP family)
LYSTTGFLTQLSNANCIYGPGLLQYTAPTNCCKEVKTQLKITANFHTHTYRCHHAEGDIGDYVAEAKKAELSVLGFSEHIPLPDGRLNQDNIHMDPGALSEYARMVRGAQRHGKNIEVLLGGECDYAPKYASWFRDELLGKLGFDYLLTATHYTLINGVQRMFDDITTPRHLAAYAKQSVKAMESGLFSCMVHPDIYMVGYRKWDENAAACASDIIGAALEYGVLLEINAKGLRLAGVEHIDDISRAFYPYYRFWELAAERKCPVIIGSDAHKPHLITEALPLCLQMAEKLGVGLTERMPLYYARLAAGSHL